jgi:hypothetical protein
VPVTKDNIGGLTVWRVWRIQRRCYAERFRSPKASLGAGIANAAPRQRDCSIADRTFAALAFARIVFVVGSRAGGASRGGGFGLASCARSRAFNGFGNTSMFWRLLWLWLWVESV